MDIMVKKVTEHQYKWLQEMAHDIKFSDYLEEFFNITHTTLMEAYLFEEYDAKDWELLKNSCLLYIQWKKEN